MPRQKPSFHLLQPRPYPELPFSVVIPMYKRGEVVVPLLRNALDRFMGQVSGATEVILVNDGSSDSTS